MYISVWTQFKHALCREWSISWRLNWINRGGYNNYYPLVLRTPNFCVAPIESSKYSIPVPGKDPGKYLGKCVAYVLRRKTKMSLETGSWGQRVCEATSQMRSWIWHTSSSTGHTWNGNLAKCEMLKVRDLLKHHVALNCLFWFSYTCRTHIPCFARLRMRIYVIATQPFLGKLSHSCHR